jgi:hypothetical protein
MSFFIGVGCLVEVNCIPHKMEDCLKNKVNAIQKRLREVYLFDHRNESHVPMLQEDAKEIRVWLTLHEEITAAERGENSLIPYLRLQVDYTAVL